jgi:hypothetical protein
VRGEGRELLACDCLLALLALLDYNTVVNCFCWFCWLEVIGRTSCRKLLRMKVLRTFF